MHLKYFLWFI